MKSKILSFIVVAALCLSLFATAGAALAKPTPKATGGLTLSDPNQQINFNAFDNGTADEDRGKVEYQNFDYPGGLHYTADVLSVRVVGEEAWFVFQIPDGFPGLSGLYVVAYVKDAGTPGADGDLYGHAATSDLNTALGWVEAGNALVALYEIVGGNLVVH